MIRAIILIHRYMGVLLGVLMTVWCLSGIVMIYVPYPEISTAQRLQGYQPIDLAHCCRFDAADIADGEAVRQIRIIQNTEGPVLSVTGEDGRPRTLSLTDGHAIGPAGANRAAVVAGRFAHNLGIEGRAEPPTLLKEPDQWTVGLGGQALWKVPFRNDAGTVIYVSQSSGEVAQMTNRAKRAWNWVGAVPHWLYPTILRKNAQLWTRLVVYSSLIGCFLTVAGLWIGIARFRPRKVSKPETRWSPYAGINYWHHVTGLVFGLLTLSFVFSGLVSMNPWGLWEGGGDSAQPLLTGADIPWREAKRMIAAAPALDLPPGTVQIRGAPFDGKLYLAARSPRQTVRFDDRGRAAGPGVMELSRLLSSKTGPGLASLVELRREDSYYFGMDAPVSLPVWRAVMRDTQATRLYIDPTTGTLMSQIGADERKYRWWHDGLHRLNFTAGLRRRPFWDAIMLLTVAGVTAVCALGAWMGIRRIGTDWGRFRP